MADPLDSYVIQAIQLLANKPVLPRIGIPADIEAAFVRLYRSGGTAIGGIVEGLPETADESTQRDVERLRDLASEAPVLFAWSIFSSVGRSICGRLISISNHSSIHFVFGIELMACFAHKNRHHLAYEQRLCRESS